MVWDAPDETPPPKKTITTSHYETITSPGNDLNTSCTGSATSKDYLVDRCTLPFIDLLVMELSLNPPTSANIEFKYNGFTAFTVILKEKLDASPVGEFSDAYAKDFEYLSADDRRPFKSAEYYLAYNFRTKILTVKMPSNGHETSISLVKAMVDQQLSAMGFFNELVLRASPLTMFGDWAKEPDACWAPIPTSRLTLGLEVASSESTRSAMEVRKWPKPPGTPVVICIITLDLRRANDLKIEVGGTMLLPNSHNTSSSTMEKQGPKSRVGRRMRVKILSLRRSFARISRRFMNGVLSPI